jgi:hypothetical protein
MSRCSVAAMSVRARASLTLLAHWFISKNEKAAQAKKLRAAV